MLMPKINKKLSLSAIILLLIFLSVSATYCFVVLSRDTYYNGIYIENIPLKTLSQDEVLERVREYSNQLNTSGSISFAFEGQIFNYNMKNLDFTYLVENAVGEAFSIGRTGGILGRLIDIWNLKKNNKYIKLRYKYNEEKLNIVLNQLKTKIYVPEKGARMFYKAGKYTLLKETVGKKLNIEKSKEAFEEAIRAKNFNEIPLVIDNVFPSSMAENIGAIDSVIASASTSFSTQEVNRSYNIGFACQKLDGMVIMPGETFSMNNALGPRTIENGYRDAKVIMLDELVDGPGGGVCQVTTTLYVAVLKSLLNVKERMHHSLTLGYVHPGQDATIADNFIDFKFINNKDYPVSINAETSKGNLTIRILSKKDNQYTVKLKSEILEVINPEPYEVIKDKSLAYGEKIITKEARQGKHVQVFREVFDVNGTLIEKTKVSDDVYGPVRGQIRMN